MLVYEGIKSGFIDDVDLGIIADKIGNKYIDVIVIIFLTCIMALKTRLPV